MAIDQSALNLLIALAGVIATVVVFLFDFVSRDIDKAAAYYSAADKLQHVPELRRRYYHLGCYYARNARLKDAPDHAPRGYFAARLVMVTFAASAYILSALEFYDSGEVFTSAIMVIGGLVFLLVAIIWAQRQMAAYLYWEFLESERCTGGYEYPFGLPGWTVIVSLMLGLFGGGLVGQFAPRMSLLAVWLIAMICQLWGQRIRCERERKFKERAKARFDDSQSETSAMASSAKANSDEDGTASS